MSYKSYKFFDMTFFIFIAIIASVINELAFNKIGKNYFYINLSLLISLIAIIRWRYIGSICFIFGGLVKFFFEKNMDPIYKFFYYVLANISIFLIPLIFKNQITKLKDSFKLSIIYIIVSVLIIGIFKALVVFIFEHNFWGFLYQYYAFDIFNTLITNIFYYLIYKFGNDLLSNMKEYLIKMQGENKDEK